MSPENYQKLKKAINTIFIGVGITVVATLVIFIATSISLIHEMKSEYKNDKFNITEELKADNKQINALRVDFIEHQRDNSKMFVEFKQINTENSKEHQAIITEMKKIKYVISKNNSKIAKDLKDLKDLTYLPSMAYENNTNRFDSLFEEANRNLKISPLYNFN